MAACPVCAAPIRDGQRFCTQCGAPLIAASTPLAAVPTAAVPAAAAAPITVPEAIAPQPTPVAPQATPVTPQPTPVTPSPTAPVAEPPADFEPVPALGPLAPAPAERTSILGLLAERETEAAPVEHPLGVPVITARTLPGPGANPAHIGRASDYATPASAGSNGSTGSASPAEAAPSTVSPAEAAGASAASPASPVGARAVAPRRYTPPPARSRAATWALVTGILPVVVSVLGNLLTAELGRQAVAATEAGVTTGAWAPVFVSLSVVFVVNAALLTVCAITGTRGVRETGNGVTRGRGLAVAGLAAGAVNLVLLVAGLVISISGFSTVLA